MDVWAGIFTTFQQMSRMAREEPFIMVMTAKTSQSFFDVKHRPDPKCGSEEPAIIGWLDMDQFKNRKAKGTYIEDEEWEIKEVYYWISKIFGAAPIKNYFHGGRMSDLSFNFENYHDYWPDGQRATLNVKATILTKEQLFELGKFNFLKTKNKTDLVYRHRFVYTNAFSFEKSREVLDIY